MLVRVCDKLSLKTWHLLGESTVIIQRGGDVQVVLDPCLVVFQPVSRCSVNSTGSGIQGYVVREYDGRVAIDEGVTQNHALELLSSKNSQGFLRANPRIMGKIIQELSCNEILFSCSFEQ